MTEKKSDTKKSTKPKKAMVVHVGEDKIQVADESTITQKQLELLSSQTPPHWIKKRKGRGGKEFDYIEISYVIGVLNAIFGFNWSVEIIDEKIDTKTDSVIIRIRLTVKFANGNEVYKDAYGGADIKRISKGEKAGEFVDIADDLKAAEADAIKKAASMLGVAWDVYSGFSRTQEKEKSEESEIDVTQDEDIPIGEKDISDIAAESHEEISEKQKQAESLASTIQQMIAQDQVDYDDFKRYILAVQSKMKPPRKIVGKVFGNPAFSGGDVEDLKFLIQPENFRKAINAFHSYCYKRQKKAKEAESE